MAKHEDETEGSKVNCELCGHHMTRRNLNKHYMYKHPDSLICSCKVCNDQEPSPSSVACNICGLRFCRPLILQAHKKVEHHAGGKFQCKYCAKLFFTNRSRYLHLHKHHGGELRRQHPQSGAGQARAEGDSGEGEDSTHVIHIGEGQGMQYLPKLSEVSLSAVIKELMIVSSDKTCKLPYKCLLCGRCFAKTKYIRLHIRRSHVKDEDQPYRCKICGSGFVRLTEFRKHSRSHSGFRPYKCKICGKAFKQQANLTDHCNIHNATKNFQCFICKRLFRQRGALNAHVIHHDTLKPFKCMFCDKGFTTRGELSRHMQHYDLAEGKNKDSKSFLCHICQESFYHFPILLKHIEERHPERPFDCQVCGEKFAAFTSLYTHKLKNEHFLEADLEPDEGSSNTRSNVRKIRRSTRDVQDAVFTIEQPEVSVDQEEVKTVGDTMLVVPQLEMIDSQQPGTTVEVVIKQLPTDDGSQTQNENEELLSIAKQLTELSAYTEMEAGETENTAYLQEEDEIIKDMLDADQNLLDNISKQLAAARSEEETVNEAYSSVDYTSANNVTVSQGVDMVVDVDQSDYVVSNEVKQESVTEVTETSVAKTISSSVEELATLIAQNSQLGLGESVTAYQTEDGSIIYVCMEGNDQVEETAYDVQTPEYQEMEDDVMKDVNTDGVQEEIIAGEGSSEVVEVQAGGETEDTIEVLGSTVAVSDEPVEDMVKEEVMEHTEDQDFKQGEDSTDVNQEFQVVTAKVEQYINDQQTFIDEDLIDNNMPKIRLISESGDIDTDSTVWKFVYDENVFRCLKCNFECSTKKVMKKHLARHMASDSRPYGCHLCSKRFLTKHELSRHMLIHTGERRYGCRFCEKKFKQPGHLKEHERIHLGQKNYVCNECPAKFITKQQLKNHWQRAHNNNKPSCDECGKLFSDKLGLIKHKGAVHSQVLARRRPVKTEGGDCQCHVCGSGFPEASQLQEHVKQCRPVKEEVRFICEVCGMGFKANHLLADHRKLRHSDLKQEICEYCGGCFKLKKQLSVHIRTKHLQDKDRARQRYLCGCGKKFTNRNALSYHIGTSEACKTGTVTKTDS